MNIYTSYYGNLRKLENAGYNNFVSIAGKAPLFFEKKCNGINYREYKILAPKFWFFKKYKEDGDADFYTKCFKEEVLSNLDANKICQELGDSVVLLCYETPDKFCHRHLVAQWLRANTTHRIIEL